MKSFVPPRRGIVFIVSAPSGAGKTTISHAALERIPELAASVSVTTRRPRGSEVDGTDYRFVTEDEFKRIRERNELAEWAQVFDACYGTPKKPLEEAIASGRDILLDIDVQGARQIRAAYPRDTVTIFVLPPTFEELEQRLRRRGTESETAIQGRLERAREEARAYVEYDYLIINDDVDESIETLLSIVTAERSRVTRLSPGFVPWKS
jgi:guanylate kinase